MSELIQSHTRLSQFSTDWSALLAAHHGLPEQQIQARQQLLDVYGPTVLAYLRGSVADAETAHELYHEFAIRLLRGDFRNAAPDQGRFRSFIKTVLYHLIVDYRRACHRAKRNVALREFMDGATEASTDPVTDEDAAFLTRWKATLVERALGALQDFEKVGGPPLRRVLQLRMEQIGTPDDGVARALAMELGRPIESSTFRRWLHLARRRFADALVAEVAWTIKDPTADLLADELQALGLLDRCRTALDRWSIQARIRRIPVSAGGRRVPAPPNAHGPTP